jgi:hypothetical protein
LFNEIHSSKKASLTVTNGSQVSSVGIVTRLQAGQPVFNSGRGQEIEPAQPPSQQVLSLGVKSLGREADHPPPSKADVKNGGAIPPLHHIPS